VNVEHFGGFAGLGSLANKTLREQCAKKNNEKSAVRRDYRKT
jgi:hypothetical protein